jgi:hypothetical protein
MRLGILCSMAVLATVATVNSGAAVSAQPALLITAIDPHVKVTGTHFRARERVRVTLRTDVAIRASWVRTGRRGSFSADLGALPQTFQCKGVLTVVARGTSGDRATVRYIVRECPPPG